MPVEDMAASASSFMLMRSLGATIGIVRLDLFVAIQTNDAPKTKIDFQQSISGAVLSTSLQKRLQGIPGYTFTGTPTTSQAYQALQHIEPASVRQEVLHEFSRALAVRFNLFYLSSPVLVRKR